MTSILSWGLYATGCLPLWTPIVITVMQCGLAFLKVCAKLIANDKKE